MDSTEIQRRVDVMRVTMGAKDYSPAIVKASFNGGLSTSVFIGWGLIGTYKCFFNADMDAALRDAEEYVANLPSDAALAKLRFDEAINASIYEGIRAGIDVSMLEQIAAGGKQPNAGEGE